MEGILKQLKWKYNNNPNCKPTWRTTISLQLVEIVNDGSDWGYSVYVDGCYLFNAPNLVVAMKTAEPMRFG